MSQVDAVSIVVPTLNEAENIAVLISRIARAMQGADISYEVVIVDDRSRDDTIAIAEKLASTYPIRVMIKQGKPGKAYSLMQGFKASKYDIIAMIDADLQYPPEEIVSMYRLLRDKHADVIVTRRLDNRDTSVLRRLCTKVYNLLFVRLLFGIDFDTQSGLKLFRKSVLSNFTMAPSPWSFDLEFLVRSLENSFRIISHEIIFVKRVAGDTKVKLLSTTLELAQASIRLRLRTSLPKIREGDRTNVQFLKGAFPAAIITFTCLATVFWASGQADALSITTATSPVIASIGSAAIQPLAEAAPLATIYVPASYTLSNKLTHMLTVLAYTTIVAGALLICASILVRRRSPNSHTSVWQ
jgi:dolichol-phosphate mannosyltransferase